MNIGETSGSIVSAELFVAYDGDLLAPAVPPVTSTAMTTDWAVEYNISAGNGAALDTLKIAMADEMALSGSGVYLYRLQARGSAGEWRSDVSRPTDLRFQQMRRMLLLK